MWQQLNAHPNYEIYSEYDDDLHCYPIRKIGTNRILKTRIDDSKGGYVMLYLNQVQYYMHRIIAEQFIANDNPENKTDVDHIDHVRTNNKIDNLRWTTHLQNANNLSKTRTGRDVEYVVELPDNAVVVERYSRFEFEGVYFHGGLFYVDTGNGNYRIVPTYMHQGYRKAGLRDKFGVGRIIMYNKFLRDYGLD